MAQSGWNRGTKEKTVETRKGVQKGKVLATAGALVLVCVVAVICFCLMETEPEKATDDNSGNRRIKEVQPAPAPKPVEPVVEEPPADKMNDVPFLKQWTKTHKKRIEIPLPMGRKRVIENGKSHFVLRPIVDPNNPIYQPIFKHNVENLLSNFAVPGVEYADVPFHVSDEEARKALAEDVPIKLGEDDEDTLMKKEAVIAFKQELKEWMDEGGHAQEYVEALQRRQNKEASFIAQGRQLIMKTIREGDVELAKGTLDKLNEKLRAEGLPAIRMPGKYGKALQDFEQGAGNARKE